MTEFVYKPLYELILQSDDTVVLNLTIPDNTYYFQGHFPEAAILPGVAQIDWVMFYLNQFFSVDKSTLSTIDVLKFQHIIRPNYQIKLSLKRTQKNKYEFSYHSEHGQHSSGRVVLAE